MKRETKKITIKVFTLKNCPKCPQAKRIAQETARKLDVEYAEVDMDTPDGQIEGLMHQIMSTPSFAIDEEVIARGRLMAELELESEVKKRLESLKH